MKISAFKTVVGLAAVAGLGLVLSGAIAPDARPQARLAPLNPDYIRHLQVPPAGPGRALPGPQDITHLLSSTPLTIPSLPPSYDLRKLNRMTPIRNQIPIVGTILFGVYGSLESFLKPIESLDFSENHLDASSYGGGFLESKVAALARWADPVFESDDPWPKALAGVSLPAVKHVQNVFYLPPRTDALDNDRIKRAVMDYGAVYAEMRLVPSLLNATYASYYNAARDENVQAVAVVGWDDNYEPARFSSPPPGSGAFICRNSYGSNFGEAGYFYVSYYDAFLARRALSAVFTAEPAAGLTVNYQHDPNGCTARLGYGNETAWFAVQFAAVSTDPLAAVAFSTYGAVSDYEVRIYRDSTPGQPRSGTLLSETEGSLEGPGYYTIPLPAPVPLLINQRFSVVVRLRTPGDLSPVPLEHPIPGYNAVFDANLKESFISPDGLAWDDLAALQSPAYARTSVCLKAFAGYSPIHPPAQLRVDRLVNNFVFFKEYVDRLTWLPNPKNTSPIVKYRIYRREADAPDTAYELLAETGPVNLVYYARGLARESAFRYRVAAVTESGREGDPAEITS